MKNSNRLLSAGFGLMMVLGLFVAAFSGTALAAGPMATPILTIDTPTNNTYTADGYMNVSWTVTAELTNVSNWTRTYEVGETPGAWVNVSDANYVNDTFPDAHYRTDVFVVHWVGPDPDDYDNSSMVSVNFTIDTTGPVSTIDYPTPDLETNLVNFTAFWNSTDALSSVDHIEAQLTNVSGGYDSGWIDVGLDVSAPITLFTSYVNLTADDYELHVRGIDNLTNVGGLDSVDFTISPDVDILNPVGGSFNPANITAIWDYELLGGTTLDHFEAQLTNATYDSGFVDVGTVTEIYLSLLNSGVDLNGTDLDNGTYWLNVTIVDSAANEYTDMVSFYVDSIMPEVDITYPADVWYTTETNFTVVWEASDEWTGIDHFQFELANDTGFYASTNVTDATLSIWITNLTGFVNLTQGNWTVTVTVYDKAGNNVSDDEEITVDLTPPVINIVAPPDDWYTQDRNFTVVWEATDIISGLDHFQVELSNDTGFYASTNVSASVMSIWITNLTSGELLGDGNWTVTVTAYDMANNSASDDIAVTVDNVPPLLDVTYPPECTNDANITVWFNASDALSPIDDIVLTLTNVTTGDLLFTGSVGVVNNVTIYDLIGYALTDGSYLLEFNVTDEAGNFLNVSYAFDVDLIPPDVEILVPGSSSGPQPVGVGTFTVTFAMEVDEEGCGIDQFNVSVENATSIVWYDDVEIFMIGSLYATNVTLPEDGNYNVTIYAIDNATNVGSDTLWIFVDSTPPLLEITAPTDYYFSQTYMNVTWITSDPDGMMANTTVYLDGSLVSNQSWEVMFYNFTGLADGLHNVTIKAHDIAWNEAVASVEFFLDTVQPVVVITAPNAGAYLNVTDVEVTWVVDDAVPSSGINHTEINIDSGSFIDVGLAVSYTFIGVADGPHTVIVRSFDNASNMGSATRSFEVDTSIPVVAISDPSEGAMFASDTVTVWWNASDASTSIDLMQYMIDGGAWTDVATNSKEFDALDDGLHAVVIRAFDLAQNVGYAWVNFTTDITDPVVTISFPAASAMFKYHNITVWWNATDATTGIDHCTYSLDGGAAVTISGAGPQFSHAFNLLTDGTHTVLVIAYDGVGNHKSASVTFKVDTHAPTIAITHPSADAYYNTATIVGTWTIVDSVSGVKQIMVKLDSGAWVNIHWNASQSFPGLTTGNHTIYLKAEDNVTNVAETNVTFHVDLVAPSISTFSPSGVAVPLRSHIVITFSKLMLKSSVGIAITPAPTSLGGAVWSNGDKTVTYYVEFADSKTYTVVVHGTDLASNAIAGTTSYQFSSLTLVYGTVVDVNGNALANANVTLTSTLLGGAVFYTNSSGTGAISILVPAGEYTIKVALSGYDSTSKTVTVGPGLSTNNLGNVQLIKTMDWTAPIIIVVVGLVVVVAILFLARRH